MLIIKATWSILKETIEILMQASPAGLNLDEIKKELEKHPDIKNIHHIHAWRLSDNIIHFQCHADVNKNLPIHEIDQIRIELENTLHKKFGIDHITIQMELDSCSDKKAINNG